MAVTLTLQDDMDTIFLDSGFQESVVYTPSGGTARTINAIVFRDGSMAGSSGSRSGALTNATLSRYYKCEMLVSTDATNGIDNPTIQEDTITFNKNVNDTSTVTWVIKGILQEDGGAYRIGLS